jgi:hypothetical protein|tara:strand:- start:717 stop:1073 length:357 start_codon:yes stop_codon:yes gene_type:complete
MRLLPTTFMLAVLPALALAAPYDGVYRQNANADCGLVGVDGGAMKIDDGIFYGVEMECLMANPVDVVDMDAVLYSMQCSGEDQTWTERAMIMADAEIEGGIIMLWNGYAFRYSRCPDE